MRRVICAVVFVASTIGFLAVPGGAETLATPKVFLSYDFSDNNASASQSNGVFNIIVDILPEHTTGVVRVVAIPPVDSNQANLVCAYQAIAKEQVECAFNFTTNGIWAIRTVYAPDAKSLIQGWSVTKLRVTN
jgi:hypothetical protein